ncbi:hypothetical protein PHMEG_00028188 [Phytophthora megakarya]|uniref:Uncharacterized protein n=1 Tax=Phytophthora megakarya TaxID=4795 RepID=A0A225V5H5_9STRA|nr:hypothetical protein PHMEG_00028188 [Phytophthora megakarya]
MSAIVCPVPANSSSVSQLLEMNAKQKHIGAVVRNIGAWEDISDEGVVKSFEKEIPKGPEVML